MVGSMRSGWYVLGFDPTALATSRVTPVKGPTSLHDLISQQSTFMAPNGLMATGMANYQ